MKVSVEFPFYTINSQVSYLAYVAGKIGQFLLKIAGFSGICFLPECAVIAHLGDMKYRQLKVEVC